MERTTAGGTDGRPRGSQKDILAHRRREARRHARADRRGSRGESARAHREHRPIVPNRFNRLSGLVQIGCGCCTSGAGPVQVLYKTKELLFHIMH